MLALSPQPHSPFQSTVPPPSRRLSSRSIKAHPNKKTSKAHSKSLSLRSPVPSTSALATTPVSRRPLSAPEFTQAFQPSHQILHSSTVDEMEDERAAVYHQGKAFLPLSLPRPDRLAIIDVDTIDGLDPVVPFTYLLHKLAEQGPLLLETTLSFHLRHGESIRLPLPQTLTFVVPKDSDKDYLPTHVLAIRPTPNQSNEAPPKTGFTGSLLPIHAIVYQASCAHVPPFPQIPSLAPGELPVIHIALPSLAQLPLVNNYLYTQRPDMLLTNLLNLPAHIRPRPGYTKVDIMQQMATAFDKKALLSRISVAHGVWGNVCALGIADVLLWKAMDTAWEILVGSVAMVQAKDSA